MTPYAALTSPLLIGKLIGIWVKQDNMRIALLQRIHQCSIGIGDDRNNRIPGPLGELGGDHLGSLDLLRGVGARAAGQGSADFPPGPALQGKKAQGPYPLG